MNTMHRGVITLIRSALTGEKLPLPEGFSLEEADPLIRRQSLLPLVYRGAENCGLPLDSELLQQYQQAYFRQVIRSAQQTRAVEQLLQTFEENGIDYMPLKGCNLKKLYPQPEMRMMGDADILIRVEQYERIKPLIEQLGYVEGTETAHEFCWKSKNLVLELHKRILDPNHEDLCTYFGDGWEKTVRLGSFRYGLCPEDEFVFIFIHMTKHFRLTGIGARQFVDLYVFRRTHPEMDDAKIESVLESVGLRTFYSNICHMLTVWFEDASADNISDLITEHIFKSGNWGTEENKIYTNQLRRSKQGGAVYNTRLKSVFRVLFMPLDELQSTYNILYKYPFLLPIFWVVRWFDVLIHRRKNIGKKFGIIKNMTDEKVSEYQQALAYMGLDYRFVEDDD